MINKLYQKFLFPSALITFWLGGSFLSVSAQTIQVSSNSANDPVIVTGQTGGTVSSQSCGFIRETPNQVLEISQRLDYMRLLVEAEGGQPTLLVDGPDGKFCVLADNLSQDNPVMSGVWPAGLYKVYIGDRGGNPHNFTLSISQQR